MILVSVLIAGVERGSAQETGKRFDVLGYVVVGQPLLATNLYDLSKHTGTNIALSEIVTAASDLQDAYRVHGETNVSISMAPEHRSKGIVTLHVFRTPTPLLLVSGRPVPHTDNPAGQAQVSPPAATPPANAGAKSIATAATNASAVTRTNTGPHFAVRAYEIYGDTLLTTETLMSVLVKYTGTNVTLADIKQAASELLLEYRSRGYPTVSVTIPQQQITNGMVKIRVFQGRLADIIVSGNNYFSSNNIMRALPSLHTNLIISGPIFQAELDRANANQDRQIYPELEPGPEPNTTDVLLKVKDRLPLHAKIELNNESSPGTPDLRFNTSAVYDNLWQHEHSFGVQYSFSPEEFKSGSQWDSYDLPLVANYSAFYRLPLGNPERIAEVVATQPGSFGFNEATRQFRLPPPSGRAELNLFASRSTIDTGLETLQNELIYDVPGVRQVSRQDVQQDITVNNDVGFRLSEPLAPTSKWRSTLSGGLDYKTYSLNSDKTNNFSFTEITVNANGSLNAPIISTVSSPVPETHLPLDYLPLSLRYDANLRDDWGMTFFGLGLTVNTWFNGSTANLQRITGSSESHGNWATLTPSLSRDINWHKDWVLTLKADGQWASEPLISTERFGVGGVNTIRGYREGEVFGDTGWHIGFEQKTPTHVIGLAYGKAAMTIRGALYMDYAETYLLDPNGAKERVPLWGTGLGTVLSVGTHWEGRFWFSWPLLSAGTTEAYQPRFNFALSGQF